MSNSPFCRAPQGAHLTARARCTRQVGGAVLAVLLSIAGASIGAQGTAAARAAAGDGTGARGLISFISERDGTRDVFIIQDDGTGERPVAATPADETNGPATPDGRRLLLTVGRGQGDARHFQYFLLPLAGAAGALPNTRGAMPGALLSPRAVLLHPAFSPDGGRLLFESESDALRDLYQAVLPGDGRAAPQPWTRNREGNFWPAPCRSPAGSRIRDPLVAFASSRDRSSQIYRMRWGGGDLRRLTYSGGSKWDVQCVGDRIYFVSDADGADRIYSIHVNGSTPRRVTQRVIDPQVIEDAPAVSPDGRQIAFVVRGRAVGAAIHIVDTTTGQERTLVTQAGHASEPTWSNAMAGRPSRLAFTLRPPDGAQPPGQAQIYVTDAAAERATQVTRARGPNWHPLWVR